MKTVLAFLLLLASLRPIAAPVLCLLGSQSSHMEDCHEGPASPAPYTAAVTDQGSTSTAPCLSAPICTQAGPAVMFAAFTGTIAQPFTSLALPTPPEAFASPGAAPPFHPPRA